MSEFVVINGQRLAFDSEFKGLQYNNDSDDNDVFDVGDEEEDDAERRRQYDAYLQAQYEKHVEELHQDEDVRAERAASIQRRRQRNGDDYEGDYDELDATKKSRTTESGATLLSVSELGQDAEWFVERESTVSKEADYIHVLNPMQRDFESLLMPGENARPETCFACSYLSNPGANQVYIDQWQRIVSLWQHGVVDVNMNWSSLGMSLYKVFTETIVATMVKLQRIDEDSTVWSPYGILYHFRYHCVDGVVSSMLHLRELDHAIKVIMDHELYLRHPSSGRLIVSRDALNKIKQTAEIRSALGKPCLPGSSTTAGASGSSMTSSVLSGKGSPLLKKPASLTTLDLVNRPQFLGPYSRHS